LSSIQFNIDAAITEINEITTVLMKSFHPQSQPLFDSYIQRYKYNHLQMCFHLSKSDIGIFVACASSDDAGNQTNEEIVGFCCVDGRPNDPSSRVEFLTESTLASTCPRPYLSDLGVLPAHRRKGIGQTLVAACEDWATKRGYDTIYLKVDETNKGTMKLYKGTGYNKTVLPGVIPGSGSKKWGNDVLLEKRICAKEDAEIEKRTNWFRRIFKKVIQSS
jgi:ribosomal protein S18 acetylase RimI-like enzyme